MEVSKSPGDPRYEANIKDDTAHPRAVTWPNGKRAIPRVSTPAALQARLKARQTCVDVDLIEEILDAIEVAQRKTSRLSIRNPLSGRLKSTLLDAS